MISPMKIAAVTPITGHGPALWVNCLRVEAGHFAAAEAMCA